jgi:hypothetical protein
MRDEATILPETCRSDGRAAPGLARLRLERQLQVLGELAEIGLELARAVEAGAKAPEADLDAAALAYARVSRAVRQTILLQSKLVEALDGRAAALAGRKAAAAHILHDLIEDLGGDEERAERLGAEAAERLEQEDFDDLLKRPFGEAVAAICRDLGLSPDWLRLAEDCFGAEAAQGGKAASGPDAPYRGPMEVRWLDDDDPPARASDSS